MLHHDDQVHFWECFQLRPTTLPFIQAAAWPNSTLESQHTLPNAAEAQLSVAQAPLTVEGALLRVARAKLAVEEELGFRLRRSSFRLLSRLRLLRSRSQSGRTHLAD